MDTVTGVGVLDKAVLVLSTIAARPRTLAGVQESTGLPRATAHRLASALTAHGMLRRRADGHYELGPELLALGRTAAAQSGLVDLARPVVEALAAETGESVQLFVREGDRRRCVVSVESPHGLRWIVPEGSLLPLDVGSSGRLLSGVAQPGPAGWLESVGEREPGVASVSAPVYRSDGEVAAALSVSGPVERLSRRPGARYGVQVADAARSLRVDGSLRVASDPA